MRRLFSRAAVILLISMMCFSVLLSIDIFEVSLVRGYDTEFQASYSTVPPIIDGVLGAEWDDANSYAISLSGHTGWYPNISPIDPVPATVYFKHDTTNIYIGLKVYDAGYDKHEFALYFDEGDDESYGSGSHDGVLTTNQEDVKSVFSMGYIEDGYYPGYWQGFPRPTSIDFEASCGLVTDHWQVEFSIPFYGNDGDSQDLSDLNCAIADIVGLKIQYWTQNTAYTINNNYWYPDGWNDEIETYTTLSFAHDFVSVTPNPAFSDQEILVNGQLTTLLNNELWIELLDPYGYSYNMGDACFTDSRGEFQISFAPPEGGFEPGLNTVEVWWSEALELETNFNVVNGIRVANVVVGQPPEGLWSYTITDKTTGNIVADFTLPAAGGSMAFPELVDGDYLIAQHQKLGYETSIAVNGVLAPMTTENFMDMTLVTLGPNDVVSVVFNNAEIPQEAFAAKASNPFTSVKWTYRIPCRFPLPVQAAMKPDINVDGQLDLVKDKPTVILVNLSDVLAPLGPVQSGDPVQVGVTWQQGDYIVWQQVTTTNGLGIKNNNITIFYPNPPTTAGNGQIICDIRYGANVPLPGNPFTTLITVKETSALSLYYASLSRSEYGTEPQADYANTVGNATSFTNATYPVPKLTVDTLYKSLPGNVSTPGSYEGILKDCQWLAIQAKLEFPKSVAVGIGIGPNTTTASNNYFAYHGAIDSKGNVAVGVSFGSGTRGVVVMDGYYTAAAHELAHTFNLYYGVPEQYKTDYPGKTCNGFNAAANEWRTGYDLMGLAPYKTTTITWVNTTSTYEYLFRNTTKIAGDPGILMVNGIIHQDDTGALSVEFPFAWYRLPQGTPDTLPTGNFALQFIDSNGDLLGTKSFDAPFSMQIDPGMCVGQDLPDVTEFGTVGTDFAGFAFATDYPTGTALVQVVDKTDQQNPRVMESIEMAKIVYAGYSAYFGGFLPPVDNGGTSVFKAGTTIPVKFQLKRFDGGFVTTAIASLWVAKITGGVLGTYKPGISASSSVFGNLFRYDLTNNLYMFDLSKKSVSPGRWQIKVVFDDGTEKTVQFTIR